MNNIKLMRLLKGYPVRICSADAVNIEMENLSLRIRIPVTDLESIGLPSSLPTEDHTNFSILWARYRNIIMRDLRL